MKKIILFSSILLIFSCKNKNDEEIINEKTSHCVVTNYNKTTINLTSQTFYTSEFEYDGDKIVKQKQYSIIDQTPPNQTNLTYGLQIKKTRLVEYNNQNLPIKITESIDENNKQNISYLLYDANGRLSEINRNTISLSDNYSFTVNSKFSYNNSNKISTIEEKSIDMYNYIYDKNIQTLTYDSEGNLRIIEKKNTENPSFVVLTKYDNYDSNPNPYNAIKVPFEDIFYLTLSKNNYRKYSKQTFVNGNPTADHESSDISGYTYNQHGYPEFALYKCQ